mmetsp:Transcript_6102/g.17879  ORF Transcript_6102/g.17879 Transcript_6102/m.17879 type:complete len:558 (-) Transcript_6102:1715-3388(-)
MHRREGLRKSRDRREEYRAYFANVARDEEAYERLHVGVDAPPFLDGAHDGGEVVVGEDHVGRLLGDLGPRHAHGDADGGLLEGGGVVHSVPRHGRDLPLRLEHPHQFLLVGRLGPAEHHIPRLEQLELLRFGLLEEFPPLVGLEGRLVVLVTRGRLGGEDVDVPGDRHGRIARVPRDHEYAYPRRGALVDAAPHLRPRRILDPHDPHEGQSGLDVAVGSRIREEGMSPGGGGIAALVVFVARASSPRVLLGRLVVLQALLQIRSLLHGQGEASERSLGQFGHLPLYLPPQFGREGCDGPVAVLDPGAPLQEEVRRPLDEETISSAPRCCPGALLLTARGNAPERCGRRVGDDVLQFRLGAQRIQLLRHPRATATATAIVTSAAAAATTKDRHGLPVAAELERRRARAGRPPLVDVGGGEVARLIRGSPVAAPSSPLHDLHPSQFLREDTERRLGGFPHPLVFLGRLLRSSSLLLLLPLFGALRVVVVVVGIPPHDLGVVAQRRDGRDVGDGPMGVIRHLLVLGYAVHSPHGRVGESVDGVFPHGPSSSSRVVAVPLQ